MTTKTKQNTKLLWVLPMVSALALSACQAHNGNFLTSFKNSLTGYADTRHDRLNTVAADAIADGHADEAIKFYEKMYLKDTTDPEIALNYAQALRKTGNLQRAVMVLSPFATAEKPEILLALEYAMVSLEMGRYERAQTIAKKILDDKKATDFHGQAHNLLGISMDAQGQYKSAENHYRQAMDSWTGAQSTTVMNNLALSLAHQGYFDESLTTLRQARLLNPSKEELARNIEIISAIRDKTVRHAY